MGLRGGGGDGRKEREAIHSDWTLVRDRMREARVYKVGTVKSG